MTLQAELESHLAQDLQKNLKNGYTSKTMKTEHGSFELETPRDRNGSFEPEIVKKSQTHLSNEIKKKMLSLFSLGSSYSQITEHIEDIYGVHFSKPAITAITDKNSYQCLMNGKRDPWRLYIPFYTLMLYTTKSEKMGTISQKHFTPCWASTWKVKKRYLDSI
jgi:transposase-like protein